MHLLFHCLLPRCTLFFPSSFFFPLPFTVHFYSPPFELLLILLLFFLFVSKNLRGIHSSLIEFVSWSVNRSFVVQSVCWTWKGGGGNDPAGGWLWQKWRVDHSRTIDGRRGNPPEDPARFLTQVLFCAVQAASVSGTVSPFFRRDESSRDVERAAALLSLLLQCASEWISHAPLLFLSSEEEESRVYILFSSFFTRHSFSSVIFSREYRVDLSRWLVPLAPFFSLLRLKFLLEFSEIPFRSLPILRYRKILLLQIHLSRRIPDDWSRIERRGLDLLILSLFRNPFPGWIESGDDVESRKRVGRKWRHQKFHADRWFPLCERDTWYTRDTRPVHVSRGGEKLARWEEPRLDRGIDSSSDYPRSIIDNNFIRLIIRSRKVKLYENDFSLVRFKVSLVEIQSRFLILLPREI